MDKPYGYVRADGKGMFIYGEHQFINNQDHELVPVYTHPKEWVGLTNEEFDYLRDNNFGVSSLISAVEAKLKEKNGA